MNKRSPASWRRLALTTLQSTPTGVLATSGRDGRPHAAAMLISVDKDFSVFLVTRRMTLKAAHLRENRRAALVVNPGQPRYLQLYGSVQEIKNRRLRSAALKRLAKVGASLGDTWPPVVRLNLGDYVVFRLKPKSIRMIDLSRQTITNAEPLIMDII